MQLQKVDPPTQVIDAFRDVQAARADKERLQNEAFGYANRIVPEARGEAERILQGAEGYKEQTVAEAHGPDGALPQGLRGIQEGAGRDAQAHVSSRPWSACSAAPTRSSSTARAGQGVVPFLPLDQLQTQETAGSQLSHAQLPSNASSSLLGARRRRCLSSRRSSCIRTSRRIVLEFGEPKRIVTTPGLYWKIPVVRPSTISTSASSTSTPAPQEVTASDQKRLVVDAFARYRIIDPLLFYQTVRDERSVRSRLGPIIELRVAPRAWRCRPSRTSCATSARR